MGRLWTFFTYLHALVGPVAMLVYPLYASVMAIESASKVDDEQWLAYWILYSFLTLMEMLLQSILEWIPIWYDIKLGFVLWLVLPQFMGAAFIYENFIREKFKQYGLINGHHHKSSSPNVKSSSPNVKPRSKFVSFITPKKGGHEEAP